MEEKFTKGPWDWGYDNDTSSIIQVFSTSSDAKGDPDICRIQSEGNAHLIAAAPEMYEMLSAISDCIELCQKSALESFDINALLKKARGEQ